MCGEEKVKGKRKKVQVSKRSGQFPQSAIRNPLPVFLDSGADGLVHLLDDRVSGRIVPGDYMFRARTKEMQRQLGDRFAQRLLDRQGVNVHLHFVAGGDLRPALPSATWLVL